MGRSGKRNDFEVIHMLKNIAGQSIGVQMTNATTGLPFTGTVTVYVTGDRGTQTIGSVGSGICVHEGKGLHTYAQAKAETNFDHVAFTFEGTGAITVTIQDYPSTIEATTTAIAASLAGTPIEVAGRVASGGGITLYIGDDCTVASGTQLSIPVSDPAGGLFTILNAIPIADLDFGASRGGKAASLIAGTVSSLAQSGSGASTLLIVSVEIIAAGTATGCVAADDYEYQISARTNTTNDFVWIAGALDLRPRRVAIP